MPFQSVRKHLVLVRIEIEIEIEFGRCLFVFLTALESPFYTKSVTSTYWDECFEHLECLGRGSFAEVNSSNIDSIELILLRF